jgi:Na+/melibiose symporter-like transporter
MALLAWAGYDGANLIQKAEVGGRILTMCTVVPFIGYTAMFLLILAYPLKKKKLRELHSALRERRAVAAAMATE